ARWHLESAQFANSIHSSSCTPSLPPLFFIILRPPPTSPLFPYTTLFRSQIPARATASRGRNCIRIDVPGAPTGSPLHERRAFARSEEHTSELQSRENLVCRLLLEKKNEEDGGSGGRLTAAYGRARVSCSG